MCCIFIHTSMSSSSSDKLYSASGLLHSEWYFFYSSAQSTSVLSRVTVSAYTVIPYLVV